MFNDNNFISNNIDGIGDTNDNHQIVLIILKESTIIIFLILIILKMWIYIIEILIILQFGAHNQHQNIQEIAN